MTLELRGARVLVTGASSGLGRAMAAALARDYEAHVLALARRQDALEDLAAAADAWPGAIEPVVLDVTDTPARQAWLQEVGPLSAAILNAGMTLTGPFSKQSATKREQMIALNVTATTAMAQELAPLLSAGRGALMLVASLGGLTPLPYQAAYGASKAYLVSLGLALQQEWKRQGVSVTTFAPGGIATEMTSGAEFASQQRHLQPADDVAAAALKALSERQGLVVPGMQNKLMAAALKILPPSLAAAIVERQFRKDMTADRA
ncbi:MAG: SDR family NAD(P)-dependent oxidoreductase [Pseudomonadota bacterium]